MWAASLACAAFSKKGSERGYEAMQVASLVPEERFMNNKRRESATKGRRDIEAMV